VPTMAQTSHPSIQEPQRIPFWRDVRVLGVLGQITFIIVVVLAAQTVLGNFAQNVGKLGEAQFICRDGSNNVKCAYDFMGSEAAFEISETVADYDVTDSYWFALSMGILNTLKVAVIGIILATLLGTFAGIARLSNNWLVSNIVKWYIELIRNTPLIIQLFFLYFSVILSLPPVAEAIRPLNSDIYLTQRGLSIPWPSLTPTFSTWLAFVVLGIIQFQVLWILLGRREEHTGRSSNRLAWGLLSFVVVLGIGWFVSVGASNNQGIMASRANRIRELEDLELIVLSRAGVNHLDELNDWTDEELNAVAISVCVLRDSPSEANLSSQLRQMNIPHVFNRSDRPDQATERYVEGSCDIFAAPATVLAAERATLESPDSNLILTVQEKPVVWSVPRQEGLNIAGGAKLSPEFTALLVGLVVYTSAFIAEIVRAGILSVSKGQSEAARALGLNESQRLQLIILPQALRVIIPPLTSQYLNLTKNSSLAIAIGFPDLWSVSYTTINQSGRAIQLIIVVMLAYLTMSLTTSSLLNWYNSRVALVER
jgi:general L-amino acid transport system permease protein